MAEFSSEDRLDPLKQGPYQRNENSKLGFKESVHDQQLNIILSCNNILKVIFHQGNTPCPITYMTWGISLNEISHSMHCCIIGLYNYRIT